MTKAEAIAQYHALQAEVQTLTEENHALTEQIGVLDQMLNDGARMPTMQHNVRIRIRDAKDRALSASRFVRGLRIRSPFHSV